MPKLTLHVPEDLVAAAKREAAARQVSVSKLVSDFFRNLEQKDSGSREWEEDLAPRTKRLVGILPDAEVDDYVDYLEKKHS